MTTLSDLLLAAETHLTRPLDEEEVVMVCQMHEAGKNVGDVLTMLQAPAPPPPTEDPEAEFVALGGKVVQTR